MTLNDVVWCAFLAGLTIVVLKAGQAAYYYLRWHLIYRNILQHNEWRILAYRDGHKISQRYHEGMVRQYRRRLYELEDKFSMAR